MDFFEYQMLATRTMNSDHGRYALANYALGLVGEYAELELELSSVPGEDSGAQWYDTLRELGDVLWYMSALCTHLGLGMNYVFSESRRADVWHPSQIAELVKKHVFHGREKHNEIREALMGLAHELKRTQGRLIDAAMTANIEKLKRRHPDGFSSNYKD